MKNYDQGITVHLKEVFIADSRISVHYRMEKADGSLVPFEFDTSGLNLENDGKIDGQQEENPEIKMTGDYHLSMIQMIIFLLNLWQEVKS